MKDTAHRPSAATASAGSVWSFGVVELTRMSFAASVPSASTRRARMAATEVSGAVRLVSRQATRKPPSGVAATTGWD